MEDPRLRSDSTRLHEMIEEINSQRDQHEMISDHAPSADGFVASMDIAHPRSRLSEHNPEPKQRPNYGVRQSATILTLPNGAIWIPNGRADNPPPSIDPDKWASMSRQARRAFATRAQRYR